MAHYLVREVHRRLVALAEPGDILRDADAALTAAPEGPLRFFRMAQHEAQLPEAQGLQRALAATLVCAAVNLADDVADGDCDYLERLPGPSPLALAPATLVFLQGVAIAWLAEAGHDAASLARIHLHWSRAAALQNTELRTRAWSFERAREVAIGVAGHQYAAYLRMLWAGSRLEDAVETLGTSLGAAAHVAVDLETGDARVTRLSARDRERLVAWAQRETAPARSLDLACLAPVIAQIDRSLGGPRPARGVPA